MRHALLAMVFGVLLARALLSSAVMIDPDHDAMGGFLMLCSGHGVMVVKEMTHDDTMQMSASDSMDGSMQAMPGMDMSGMSNMAMPVDHVDVTVHHAEHDQAGAMSHSSDLCAFSAALATALASIVVFFFLFAPLQLRESWRRPRATAVRALLLHIRPPTRAPPVFA
ncbi:MULTISPECIES: hypothetical protein [unclassified Caballeronia]|uniref:hypothetical protein n=1 Tax=unclassified Caballeronia TaxID=2646786 RepID=UPI00285D4304|nr:MULTISPECIES: hypothetical protein [unclassified Caballeronia]MDR5818751.1 hypothetical protein [Caballeronia sp. LZ033]MDR5884144.1 hypothetical protein [Caballeronia sp. LZ032]